ncbi:polyprenyl synthetase family protein [Egicoccus sp. AB-alg6-2]|uniref:polyprenyl synthetase family protein n=1 Tax=Egicoccus sp. AB-alg6-2 TaxID=3242692 RepID=UPI00359D05F8
MEFLHLLAPPVRGWLDERLGEVDQRLHALAGSATPLTDRSGRHLLSAGGKRFRPLVTLLVAAALDADATPARIRDAAASVELLHLSTLCHDDVIDGAATRRGVPSVNARWGERLAVAVGDRLTALAFEAAAGVGDELPALMSRTYRRLVEGERLETRLVGRLDGGPGAYLDVVDGKTASLLAAAARAGAVTTDTPGAVRAGIESWGRTVGVAFQLADDLQDLTATEARAGKPVGRDLELGVYTWPVLDASASRTGARLRTVLAAPPPHPPRVVEEAMGIVRSSGSLERADALVQRLLDRADHHLEILPPGPACSALRALSRTLVPAAAPVRTPAGVGA